MCAEKRMFFPSSPLSLSQYINREINHNHNLGFFFLLVFNSQPTLPNQPLLSFLTFFSLVFCSISKDMTLLLTLDIFSEIGLNGKRGRRGGK